MPGLNANGNGPAASGAMTRTQSFAPITPVVKERVGDVANRLSEVEKIIDEINLQSATTSTRSPTMGDFQQEVDVLKKDINQTRDAQKKQMDALRNEIKNDVKEQIGKKMRPQIEKKIAESVEAQVKIDMREWGQSTPTKKLIEDLMKMAQDNDALRHDAQITLDNSRSRHANSTLDEHADLETELSKIKLPNGSVSKAYPHTLGHLFLYDEQQLLQLFDDYRLQRLNTHLENLNRFLAFIGLRFSIPQQSLDFLDHPPAYPSSNVPESSKEKPHDDPPVPPQNQGENRTEAVQNAQPEHEPPPREPAITNNNPIQARAQEKELDKKQTEEGYEAKQDRGGQPPPAGIELSTFQSTSPSTPSRRSSTGAVNQRLSPTTNTFPTGTAHHRIPSLPPPPHQYNSQGQGTAGVSGWIKWAAGDR